ncbi:DMT family transporter [Flavobacterium salilacus subsp. salilacus]|uniref:DMT family transporter n=1 Tax=Flavobacterium TaxID=237 RepID=UPI00107534F1|nr:MULTISPECIES: DMT family transporter [Flavobacterium]KAF2518726.1 DMT family transporter [Flavobacterium salilacus subsp. salilacus]MBE1613692.1 DMT family transporter [Flavobacterium sp. SaA2.13]
MIYLILSIISSVTVGIIFKIARRYSISVMQIVMWNYVFALSFCYFAFVPDVSTIDKSAPWAIYISLAILLPTIFLFLAASIRHMGIVKTDAAQRLSLIIPVLAAYFIFREDFNIFKLIGLIIAFPAIILILSKSDNQNNKKWIFPAVVLIGFGVVDILFKQIALYTKVSYTTSLFIVFCGALVTSILFTVNDVITCKTKILIKNILFGALIGVFNFANILFYLKAHRAFSENPSTVFASMNIGVIVLGSLAGVLLFKEKMSILNYAGIFLALAAILFITLSQVY